MLFFVNHEPNRFLATSLNVSYLPLAASVRESFELRGLKLEVLNLCQKISPSKTKSKYYKTSCIYIG